MGWIGIGLFSTEETQLKDYVASLNEKGLEKFKKEVAEKEEFVKLAKKVLKELNEKI